MTGPGAMESLAGRLRCMCELLQEALLMEVCALLPDTERDAPQACPAGFCSRCPAGGGETDIHRYGLNEARRWGGSYIYYCPVGLAFVTACLPLPGGQAEWGAVLGPVVLGEFQDLLLNRQALPLYRELDMLPVVSPPRIRKLADLLRICVRALTDQCGAEAGEGYDQQSFLNTIYDMREKYTGGEDCAYILSAEAQLQTLIVHRDREGTQRLLNELLGKLYFSQGGDLTSIKTRIVELIVVLSRAVISAGADVGEIFRFNTAYVRQMDELESIDEISQWLSGVVHGFLSATFDYADVKHADVVYKVMEYIRRHCESRFTLDELAKHVYLSRSYLSSIFRLETGRTLSSEINRMRIEHSKRLLRETGLSLAEIAVKCCFDDQSYFTKVFKKYVGISPKKYRDSGR